MAEMEIQVVAMVKTAKVLMVRMVAVVVEVRNIHDGCGVPEGSDDYDYHRSGGPGGG